MCLDFAADEIKKGDYENYRFTELQKQLIETSWRNQDPYLYGRFDFGYDGDNLKMFEYNADTPTSCWRLRLFNGSGWSKLRV